MRGSALFLVLIAALNGSGAPEDSRRLDHQAGQVPPGPTASPLVGEWVADMAKSKPSPDYAFTSATLRIELADDSMTMSSHLVLPSGEERRAAETFRTDGTETRGTLTPGVTLVARWLDPHVLASLAKKEGKVIAVVTYEVSADGQTLTSRSSGTVDQTIVFNRRR